MLVRWVVNHHDVFLSDIEKTSLIVDKRVKISIETKIWHFQMNYHAMEGTLMLNG
jgi:hypothetical protein